MNIPTEDLANWLRKSQRVNAHLLKLIAALSAGQVQDATQHAWDAQKANALLWRALERDGMVFAGSGAAELPEDYQRQETPVELLSSPAAQRYAEALRECARACQEMEQERGIEDGLTEMFEDYAHSAELEVFGPVGLRGRE